MDNPTFIGKSDRKTISRRGFMLAFMRDLVNEYHVKTVLDIGAGVGSFCFLMKWIGLVNTPGFSVAVDGLEKNPAFVEIAKKHGLHILQGAWPDDLPSWISRGEYDLITMNEVAYYFKDLHASLVKTHSKLRHNGILFIKYRNAGNTQYTPPELYRDIFGPELVRPIGPEILEEMEAAGFEIVRWLPYPEDNMTLMRCYLSLGTPYFEKGLVQDAQTAKHTIIIGRKK
jgi:SAM-dependent methyltransferase